MRRRTCSKGVLHLINTSDARPDGYKQALPGHTVRRRRPYNAENYFPRP
jgi:hypothetical protein